MSIYMPHYGDKKSFMVSAIKKVVRDMKTEAQNEAENSIKCSGETCSEAELSAQRLETTLAKTPYHQILVIKSRKFSKNATEQS